MGFPCGSFGEESERREYPPPDLPLEKSIWKSRSNRTGHGTTDWFQIGEGKAVYCHPVYSTYMQSTS